MCKSTGQRKVGSDILSGGERKKGREKEGAERGKKTTQDWMPQLKSERRQQREC